MRGGFKKWSPLTPNTVAMCPQRKAWMASTWRLKCHTCYPYKGGSGSCEEEQDQEDTHDLPQFPRPVHQSRAGEGRQHVRLVLLGTLRHQGASRVLLQDVASTGSVMATHSLRYVCSEISISEEPLLQSSLLLPPHFHTCKLSEQYK